KKVKVKGKVYLVGAGPGRADLITVRGAELVGAADCIICDKLANPALLSHASPNTEIIHVPKRVGTGSCKQEEINKLLIEKASNGKTVVRLKGGDPCVFGRGAEEATVLAEAGIDFEIVPGVTAAIAAAEYSGIMFTHREYSSQVIFITGHEAEGKKDTNIDWRLLAKFPGTIVFYMAMGNLDFIIEQLIKNGMEKEMPAAVVTNATFPTQKAVKTSLRRLGEKCKHEKIGPPAIVIVGAAADSGDKLNWFMKKPLFGRNIVVTRDRRGNTDFAAKIIRRGGNPIEFATIEIKPLTQANQFLQTLTKLSEFDWIIFTSANGVSIFFESLQSVQKDARVFGSAKIAAIGSETARRLNEFGIKADFVPTAFTGKELGKQLIAFVNLQGKNILLLRSQLASKELAELLVQAKAKVNDTAIYTIVPEKSEFKWLKEKIADRAIDWLTFASPSSVNAFFEQIQADLVNSSNVKVASIGPVTSQQLKNLGVKVDVEPTEHTIDGLLTAIEGMY
ncbi:MAG: uroporphyrinogen-III C-methyltransferase, partial [Planctomycetota bacterium]